MLSYQTCICDLFIFVFVFPNKDKHIEVNFFEKPDTFFLIDKRPIQPETNILEIIWIKCHACGIVMPIYVENVISINDISVKPQLRERNKKIQLT